MQTAVEASYPLTPTQHEVLRRALTRSPDRGAGQAGQIEQVVVRLRGPVDSDRLGRAFGRAVERHAALRSSLAWPEGGEPVQRVHPAVRVPLRCLDLGDADPAGLAAFLEADGREAFDLGAPPLMRLHLLRLPGGEAWLVWTVSRALLDRRAAGRVLREVLAEAGEAGPEEAPPPAEPADAALRRQAAWLGSRDRGAAQAYWRETLRGFAGPTPLPPSFPPQAAGDGPRRGERRLSLGPALAGELAAWARAHAPLDPQTLFEGVWASLLGRYGGEEDVLFGSVRALPGVGADVAVTTAAVPLRVAVDGARPTLEWLRDLQERAGAALKHAHLPPAEIGHLADLPAGPPLFESVLVVEGPGADGSPPPEDPACPGAAHGDEPLTLTVTFGPDHLTLGVRHDRERLADDAAARLLEHVGTHLAGVLAQAPGGTLAGVPLLTPGEEEALAAWNDTAASWPRHATVDALIARQARQHPEAVALVFGDEELSYADLDARATRLARRLRALGVRPGALVGVGVPRSLDLPLALLAVLRAGGAYVPLDPAYPEERLSYMLGDSGAAVLLTHRGLAGRFGDFGGAVLNLDEEEGEEAGPEGEADLAGGPAPDDLAYVIYTSGSTGRPKGVMVRHRNVVNFFSGMDRHVRHDPPGVWLAVTSPSFDISVLELLWTLARGFRVVVAPEVIGQPGARPPRATRRGALDFSLFYFASGEGAREGYDLLMEGARFADTHGFRAVWTPERHFHAFGGLYPNPAVMAAALAAVTRRVEIRAGSVVLPLHHPVRVAEDWALVDTLSGGRVGVSFASGWQPDDFVLAPEHYADRREVLFQHLDVVRRLWRGERVELPGPRGERVGVRTLPRPVQPELPVWITAAGNEETFREAGEAGANLLTHLLGQSVEELAVKVAAYRRAWREAGHPGEGHVTLMLHTLVGEDREAVRDLVRAPMKAYLASSVNLIRTFAAAFPAFRPAPGLGAAAADAALRGLSAPDLDALLDHAFERYFETSGLFGTPESCRETLERVTAAGVNEVACLIDFGVPAPLVLRHLEHLDELRRRWQEDAPRTLPELITRHGVTHLQCTPALARVLLADEAARAALGRVEQWLIGGEALGVPLARAVGEVLGGDLINMYGPTETTIWSSAYRVPRPLGDGGPANLPLGEPLVNTTLHVLDDLGRPVPLGVAGELYIGGEGVTAGYLHRPDLTADRFVTHPLDPAPGARLYRSGDRARRWADGTLEILGRADHQVKIRGHRIEPGEVEAALLDHPGVREALVVAREDVPGDLRLVAYTVAREDVPPTEAELRAHLRTRLPEFMLPGAYVALDRVPLTPNGKADRRALPAPGAVQVAPAQPPIHAQSPEPARTPEVPIESPAEDVAALRETLTRVWQEVLGRAQVGPHENFFDLGGHSLLAVQLLGRVRAECGRPLELTDLFQYTTVHALAEHLARGAARGASDPDGARPAVDRAAARRAAQGRRQARPDAGAPRGDLR